MPLRNIPQFLTYLAVRVFVCLVQAVAWRRASGWPTAGHDGHRCRSLRRKMIDENLRHAFPELASDRRRKMAKRMWKHLFLLVAEVAHAPRKIHETNWRDYVRLKDADVLVRLLLDDRPLLLVSGHFGNFELAGFILGISVFPRTPFARPLDNPYLHAFVNRFRGATGQHIVPTKGGDDQILAVLRSGGTMAFLADQYAGTKGCWVKFFGRPASAHKAIALLALDNDAPMAVGYAQRLGSAVAIRDGDCGVADPRNNSRPHDHRRASLDRVVHQRPSRNSSAALRAILVAARSLEGPSRPPQPQVCRLNTRLPAEVEQCLRGHFSSD